MKRSIYHLISMFLVLALIGPAHVAFAEDSVFLECGHVLRARAAAEGQGPVYQYAPDRKVDILHVAIDVTPDFKDRTVAGVTTIQFCPIAKELAELSLDAVDLDVTSVSSDAPMAGYNVTDKKIVVTFDEPVAVGRKTSLAITYEAEPQQGLYFRTPELGYNEEDMHLFTQGEAHKAPHWYPNYDYPNERSTSEVTCRVPQDMTVLSNGTLVCEKVDPSTGLKAVTWLQAKPHVNYLIALAAGHFKKIETRHGDIPLAFYTPASMIDLAENSFQDTADILAFYERYIGIPYPWNKYDQVVVKDFVAGGMENTTLTILTDRTLFPDETENIHSSQGLVAHEFVHQWFGDYVTCKDWSHLWLNEGFAVYYEKLYDGHKNGRDSMLYGFYLTAQGILRDRSNEKPIVWRHYDDAGEQFDYRAYSKGAWVLRMLSAELGEDLLRKCIKTYLERHALSSVTTPDLVSVVEELSGRSLDRFFDQWVYHAGFPKLTVSYKWSGVDKLAKVSIRQTQKVSDDVMLFHGHTKLRFVVHGEPVDKEIVIDEKEQDLYFPLEEEPAVVRFDPELTLLAKVTFNKPTAMLYAQLVDQNDVVGRRLAIEALKKKKDKKTVARLKAVLNADPFWGIRRAASQALREIHTEEAFDALAESMEQPDARVRRQVVQDIAGFYRPESLDLTKRVLETERNPEIVAAAIRNLGKYQMGGDGDLLIQYLKSDSHRSCLARAALQAMRMLHDPEYIEPLKETARDRHGSWPTWLFTAALDGLAHLSRDLDDKTTVREFLVGYASHPHRNVQVGAINALGTLGDPKAIPVVQTFLGEEPYDRIERAAKSALDKLQKTKELVPEEVIALRKLVDELRKDTQKLTDELEDVKKRLDAKETQGENDSEN